MKKIITTILILDGLLLPIFAFAFTYERNPAGSGEINSPITIHITLNNMEEICDGYNFWGVTIKELLGGGGYSSGPNAVVPSSELDHVFEITLPLGPYQRIAGVCGVSPGATGNSSHNYLEANFGNPIFTIVEPPPPPPPQSNFINITSEDIDKSLSYGKEAVTGIAPLLYFIIGAPIGFWVIRKVSDLVFPKD